MAWLIGLVTGPFGKIILYIIVGLFASGTLYGIYHIIQKQASTEQILKDNNAQLKQSLADQKAFIAATQALMDLQQKSSEDLNKKIDEVKASSEKLNDYLDSPAAKEKDRPTSDIIKEVVRQLMGDSK